jgi:3',5'-cyclic AMP phosphodiesterase CpdA
MKRRAFLAAGFLSLAASGCGFRPFGGFRPFTFILIADPQLGFLAGGDGNEFTVEAGVLERVVAGINRMRPAPEFVAVCGDLTHIPGHPAQIAAYKRLMGMVNPDIPVHNLSGNHDFSDDLSLNSIAAYRKVFGPDRYSFEVRGWRFIALNSTLLQLPGKRPEELAAQTEWLRKTLTEASRSRGIVVFMHHPFSESDISGGPDTRSIGRTYLDLFAGRRVAAVFSGHTHRTVPEKTYRGVRLINTNGLVRSFDDNPGLRVVRVFADRIEHEFIPVKPGKDFDLTKPVTKTKGWIFRDVA